MKQIRNIIVFAALAFTVGLMTSCNKEGNETIALENGTGSSSDVLRTKYFTMEDAILRYGSIPGNSSGGSIGSVTVNNQALSGGMNFIVLRSTVLYKIIYIGVRGIPEYYAYTPKNVTQEGGYYVYIIPIYYTEEYNTDMYLTLSGETQDGEQTETHEEKIAYVSSLSGDININLTFTTAKDVDLHLYMPDGKHIYFKEKGGTVTINGRSISYGLDHDSNAGCRIDNLNNENIYIPEELVVPGQYRVVVNLYENCNNNIGPTYWTVIARYRGNTMGVKTGTYAKNASRSDMTQAFTFTITQNQINSRRIRAIKDYSFVPFPVSDIASMKEEAEKWE